MFAKRNKTLLHGSNWTTVSFLAPVFILFCIFVIYPIINSMWISLHKWGGFGAMEWVGFKNYAKLLHDERFITSFKNNLWWILCMLLSPVLGLALALFLNQKIKGMRYIKSLFFFPFVINLVVVGLVFSWFYNPDFGLLAELFKKIGLTPIPILASEKIATFGIIVAALWPQTAYCMILYLTGLTNVNSQVLEAARIDGSAGFNMLWHIMLPQLRPATFIAVVVTVIGSLRSFDLIAIMTAGGPWGSTYVLAYQMYIESLFNFKMGYGAAIATILFLMMCIYIGIFLHRLISNEKR